MEDKREAFTALRGSVLIIYFYSHHNYFSISIIWISVHIPFGISPSYNTIPIHFIAYFYNYAINLLYFFPGLNA